MTLILRPIAATAVALLALGCARREPEPETAAEERERMEQQRARGEEARLPATTLEQDAQRRIRHEQMQRERMEHEPGMMPEGREEEDQQEEQRGPEGNIPGQQFERRREFPGGTEPSAMSDVCENVPAQQQNQCPVGEHARGVSNVDSGVVLRLTNDAGARDDVERHFRCYSHRQQMGMVEDRECPLGAPGTEISVTEAEDGEGLDIRITAAELSDVRAIRNRVRALVSPRRGRQQQEQQPGQQERRRQRREQRNP